jgi:cobalamin-dependent methionine synthase I
LQGCVRGPRDDGSSPGRRDSRELRGRPLDDARNDKFLSTTVGKDVAAGTAGGARSDVNADNPIPTAPFFGVRTIEDIPLDEVFSLLDLDELYRLQWGARGSGEAYDAALREFEPTRARLQESAK